MAVGDALGTTLEFKAPGTFKPITDMIGGGPFGLQFSPNLRNLRNLRFTWYAD
jgi:hypothetical protein